MGIGTGMFLLAVGAIMRFAVSVQTKGFNVHTIGVTRRSSWETGILDDE